MLDVSGPKQISEDRICRMVKCLLTKREFTSALFITINDLFYQNKVLKKSICGLKQTDGGLEP